MNIKNYTSSVSAETTIARMEAKLAAAGVDGIMKMYNEKRQVSAIAFRITLDRTYSVKLPANAEACFQALWKEYCRRTVRPREATKATIREQAHRTAWKLLEDWVLVQLSMVEMNQADFREVFLAYLWDGKETYFERLRSEEFKALPAPPKS